MGIVIVIALIIGGALYFSRKPSELEKFRAELRSKGYKLSPQELLGNQKPPWGDSDAYMRVQKHMQEIFTAYEQLDKLNSNRWQFGKLPLMRRGPIDTPFPLTKRDNPWWGGVHTNSANKTWEHMAEVMKQAGSTLQTIRALARKEIPEHGLRTSTPAFMFQILALWLNADALNALRQGSRITALEDLQCLTDLALIGSQEKHLQTQFERIKVIGFALRGSWEILQSAEWTDQELNRIEAAWKRISPLQASEACMVWQLAQAGDVEATVRRHLARASLRDRVTAMVGRIDRDDDALFLLQHASTYLEAVRALQQGEDWTSLKPGLEKIQSSAMSKWNSRYRHLGVRMMAIGFETVFADAIRAEAGRQLLLADVAVRKFRLRHNGTPPKTLRELSPDFLNVASGHDPFSGGDLKYRLIPDGSYLLYSVGIDGVDNGGDLSVDKGQGLFFWGSRDMAWPSCQ